LFVYLLIVYLTRVSVAQATFTTPAKQVKCLVHFSHHLFRKYPLTNTPLHLEFSSFYCAKFYAFERKLSQNLQKSGWKPRQKTRAAKNLFSLGIRKQGRRYSLHNKECLVH